MNRVCKVCGVRKKLNMANFGALYRVSRRTGSRLKTFRHTCKTCSYDNKKTAMASSSSPELYLYEKWKVLYKRRLKADIEVCPSLIGRKGLSYLMELWSEQRGLCAVTGLPMTWGRVNRKDIQSQGYGRTVGIDRIDASVGYVRGNLQLVCSQVNYMRGGLSQEDFLAWCESVIRGQEPPFC